MKYATTSGSTNAVAWGNVSGKPSTYPPSTHTHNVTKADVGLGKVNNTADADKSVKYATTSGSTNAVTWGNVSGKPSTFTPSSHTHSYLSTSGGTVSDHITIKRTGDTGTGYFLNLNRDGKQIWKIGISNAYELKIGDFGTGDHVTTPVTLSKTTHVFGSNNDTTRNTYLRGSNVRIYAHTGGAVYLGYTGSTAVTSDENLKNLYDISDNYDIFFDSLIPKLYKYKKDGCHRYHIGFGARQVEEALHNAELSTEDFAGILIDKDVTMMADEAGTEEDVHYDELYSLRYEEFISLNTWQIQKLKTKISEQQKEIDELKNEVSSLKELMSTQNNTELD